MYCGLNVLSASNNHESRQSGTAFVMKGKNRNNVVISTFYNFTYCVRIIHKIFYYNLQGFFSYFALKVTMEKSPSTQTVPLTVLPRKFYVQEREIKQNIKTVPPKLFKQVYIKKAQIFLIDALDMHSCIFLFVLLSLIMFLALLR